MKSIKKVLRIISSALLIVILGGIFIYGLLRAPAHIWAPAVEKHQASSPVLWIRDNIYMNPNSQPQMVVENENLILIASEDINSQSGLVAFDAYTGETVWKHSADTNQNNLASLQMGVFVGGVGKVVAYNTDAGEVIWETKLPFTRSVTKLVVQDSILYVDTVSANHFLLETSTGKTLQSINYASGNVPVWSDHDMSYTVVEQTLYYQSLGQRGSINDEIKIVAADKESNLQLWKSVIPAASRLVANDFGAFVLTLDGELLYFDPTTGQKEVTIHFTPALQQYYHSEEIVSWEYGYHVAIDEENQLIFVYLGDSAQLFSFRLPQKD